MSKPLIIVGVDPGTTTAFAVLDLKGELLEVESRRHINTSDLIERIIDVGIPVVTATDVSSPPSLVEEVNRKFGGKLISPEEDMKVREKKELSSQEEYDDTHEMDAIAAGKYAAKRIRASIDRVEKLLEENGFEEDEDEVKKLVLKEGLTPKASIDILSEEDEESSYVDTEKGDLKEDSITKEDFKGLLNRFHRVKKEVELLRDQNEKLKHKLKEKEEEKTKLENKTGEDRSSRDQKLLNFKEKRIRALKRDLEDSRGEVEDVNDSLDRLRRMIADSDNVVVKKFKNLGSSEYDKKKDIFDVQEGDILFVEDPSIVSSNVVKDLRNKNIMIIYMDGPGESEERLPFPMVSSEEFDLDHTEYFAFASEKRIKKKKDGSQMLKKIVKDYR